MNQLKILICDESSIMRRLTKKALEADARIAVVGEAESGSHAIEQIAQLRPDVLIVDVALKDISGPNVVRRIRSEHPHLPIIMHGRMNSRNAELNLESMSAGASDFAAKPSATRPAEMVLAHVQSELLPKVIKQGNLATRDSQASATALPKTASDNGHVATPGSAQAINNGTRIPAQTASVAQTPHKTNAAVALKRETPPAKELTESAKLQTRSQLQKFEIIVIAVSTGGPQALQCLLETLPSAMQTPILIVQHMPAEFTPLLAERLTRQAKRTVVEATQGQVVQAGLIAIAPGDYHMKVVRDGVQVSIDLEQYDHINSCRPSADPLFESAVKVYGKSVLGVVLTGMGRDGADGAREIKGSGGLVFAQDEASSTVWGMPGEVVRRGLADKVLSIDQMAGEIFASTGSVFQALKQS